MGSILDAAQKGREEALRAMRDKLAADMDDAPPSVVAQIAARLQSVLSELADISKGVEVTSIDELAQRRTDRIATPESSTPAPKRTRQRRA